MASFGELADLVKLALGTPETVNFKALHRLLVGIINRLSLLCGKGEVIKDGGKEEELRAKRRKASRTDSVSGQPHHSGSHRDDKKDDSKEEEFSKTKKTAPRIVSKARDKGGKKMSQTQSKHGSIGGEEGSGGGTRSEKEVPERVAENAAGSRRRRSTTGPGLDRTQSLEGDRRDRASAESVSGGPQNGKGAGKRGSRKDVSREGAKRNREDGGNSGDDDGERKDDDAEEAGDEDLEDDQEDETALDGKRRSKKSLRKDTSRKRVGKIRSDDGTADKEDDGEEAERRLSWDSVKQKSASDLELKDGETTRGEGEVEDVDEEESRLHVARSQEDGPEYEDEGEVASTSAGASKNEPKSKEQSKREKMTRMVSEAYKKRVEKERKKEQSIKAPPTAAGPSLAPSDANLDEEDRPADEDLGEWYRRPDSTLNITAQDLDDIVKRVEVLEKTVLQPRLGTILVDKEDFDKVTKKQDTLQKWVDMMEKETDDRLMAIQKEIKEIDSQLQYLPRVQDLYKSFFPSWKMLEDAMCSHPSLKQNIQEVKVGIESGDPSVKKKQLPKFLGSSGPSDRLLKTLEVLGNMAERNNRSSFDLTSEVAQAKMSTSIKKASGGPLNLAPSQASEVQVTHRASVPTVDSSPDASGSKSTSHAEIEQALSFDTLVQVDEKWSTIDPTMTTDAGFLSFKMAKLAEQTLGIRKDMDEMSEWREKLTAVESDLKHMADLMVATRKEMEVKDERTNDMLTNIQMDLSEFHQAIFSMETKKNLQARKQEIDSVKQRVDDEGVVGRVPGIFIDREARIRTQQLQMQVNALNQMIAELENCLPEVQYSPAPAGLPEDIQHPWGTGRGGAGTSMRAGVGTTATAVSPPTCRLGSKTQASRGSSPTGSPRAQVRTDSRPSPLGSTEEKSRVTAGIPSPESGKRSLNKTVEMGQVMLRPNDGGRNVEESVRVQNALTRLNAAYNAMASRLECCQNQINSENRRLQDLMSRMQRESMNRCAEIQEQLNIALGDVQEPAPEERTSDQGSAKDRVQAGNKVDVGKGGERKGEGGGLSCPPPPPTASPVDLMGSDGPRPKSPSTAGTGPQAIAMLAALRKELLAHIAALRKRIVTLEAGIPYVSAPETDASLLKKPLLHRFQCLACDKRVEMGQHRGPDGGAVPSSIPELPHLPPLTSPPRLRNSKSNVVRVRPVDMYEIPRQCGGSYTASHKPRRVHYFSNLGDVMDNVVEPVPVQRVDVKGTDGHIYKGQVQKGQINRSSSRDMEQLNLTDRSHQ